MRLSEINSSSDMPFRVLYHATNTSNLASIQQHGLLANHYGKIHGEMEMHPPKPSVYLSRNPTSNNLHSNLWSEPVSLLKISTYQINTAELWPDDWLFEAVGNGEMLGTISSIRRALKIDQAAAEAIMEDIENANEVSLPIILKPFWRWYLMTKTGGDVSYTADIPPDAIVSSRDYPSI